MMYHFLRKRWLDFRNGHSIYLAFVLTFVNFILIAYTFAISKLSFLHGIMDNIIVFALVFIGIYVPAAAILGYWHRRNQYSVENEAMMQENWISAWTTVYLIRLIEGKATPQETKEITNYLTMILKRQNKMHLLDLQVESEDSKASPSKKP